MLFSCMYRPISWANWIISRGHLSYVIVAVKSQLFVSRFLAFKIDKSKKWISNPKKLKNLNNPRWHHENATVLNLSTLY